MKVKRIIQPRLENINKVYEEYNTLKMIEKIGMLTDAQKGRMAVLEAELIAYGIDMSSYGFKDFIILNNKLGGVIQDYLNYSRYLINGLKRHKFARVLSEFPCDLRSIFFRVKSYQRNNILVNEYYIYHVFKDLGTLFFLIRKKRNRYDVIIRFYSPFQQKYVNFLVRNDITDIVLEKKIRNMLTCFGKQED